VIAPFYTLIIARINRIKAAKLESAELIMKRGAGPRCGGATIDDVRAWI
jgi:hypothetical protein